MYLTLYVAYIVYTAYFIVFYSKIQFYKRTGFCSAGHDCMFNVTSLRYTVVMHLVCTVEFGSTVRHKSLVGENFGKFGKSSLANYSRENTVTPLLPPLHCG